MFAQKPTIRGSVAAREMNERKSLPSPIGLANRIKCDILFYVQNVRRLAAEASGNSFDSARKSNQPYTSSLNYDKYILGSNNIYFFVGFSDLGPIAYDSTFYASSIRQRNAIE